ncbi:hypothetical protein DdX_17417 [Ditylenchus destructor]|uniref:Uncharacterized protein n=1 Tax=Ditylenchus destructor TaxID=166010 RepID=A0AAD4QZ09_9BILA|nr:hypothetical protein DdX_17417 [Ditylenchus destructor]
MAILVREPVKPSSPPTLPLVLLFGSALALQQPSNDEAVGNNQSDTSSLHSPFPSSLFSAPHTRDLRFQSMKSFIRIWLSSANLNEKVKNLYIRSMSGSSSLHSPSLTVFVCLIHTQETESERQPNYDSPSNEEIDAVHQE